jgi:hypothetical protein
MHNTDPAVGKHSSMGEMLAIALETVHTYSDCIKCYTDGSASDGTAHGGKRRSGYGVLVLGRPMWSNIKLRSRDGSHQNCHRGNRDKAR